MGKAITILAGSTAAAQLIPLLASPVLTRIYTPSQYGVLAVFVSVLVLVSSVDTLRYEMAIPIARDERDASELTLLVFALLAPACVVALLVVAVFRFEIAELLHAPALSGLAWFLPLSMAGLGSYQLLYFRAIREKRFAVIARTRIAQAAAKVIVQIAGGLAGLGALSLVLGDLLARTIGAGRLGIASTAASSVRALPTAGSVLPTLARRYRRFPLFSAPSGLLNTAAMESVALLVAWAFSPAVAGQFSLTQRVITVPMAVIGVAVGEAYLGTAAELARRSPGALNAVIRSSARRLFLLGVGPALVLAAAGPVVVPFIFGSEWAAAGEYARLLAPAFLAQFVAAPLSQTSNILSRQGSQLALDAGRLAAVVCSFGVGRAAGLSPCVTIGLYSLFTALSYAIMLVLYVRWSQAPSADV